jgi:hypothetical protein
VYGGKADTYSLRKFEDASKCKTAEYSFDNMALEQCTETEENVKFLKI